MARKTTATPKVTKEGEWVDVKCAFCRGTGKDPFGVLSVLSTCGTCGGKGTVRVKEPYVPCLACGGKGVTTVEKPVETCPVCQGTGIDGLHLHCLRCFGTGVVTTAEKAGAT